MGRRWLPLVSVLTLVGLVLGPAARTLCAMTCLRPAAAAGPAVAPHGEHAHHGHHAPVASPRVDPGPACAPLTQRPCQPPAVTSLAATSGVRHLAGDVLATLATAPVAVVGTASRPAATPPQRRAPPPGPARAPLPLRI